MPDDGLLCNLLNSGPDEYESDFSDPSKGVGFIYGKKPILDFINKNNVDLIIRCHSPADQGFEYFADNKFVTIFSVPNFNREFNNFAAIANIDNQLNISFKILKPKCCRFL